MLWIFLNPTWSQDQSVNYKSKYHVILVIDGPRYSETYGHPTAKYIPNLKDSLMPQGTFFSNFRNNGPTFTNPGHAAITTGRYQHISNAGGQLPKYPSLFQYYLEATGTSQNDAQVITSKGKLNVLANTRDKKWKNQFVPEEYCGINGNGIGYADDEKTMAKVSEVLGSQTPPHLLLINLLGVDVEGHANRWEKYLTNIQKTDQFAKRIWDSIQSNPKLRDQTTLFITNDHGRHLDGVKDAFVNHGCGCEGCRHISLLVLGPDVPKNKVISSEAEMIDISKTIATMLGIEMPTSRGRHLKEIFKSER